MTLQEWVKKKKSLLDAGFKEETNLGKFIRDYRSKPNDYETKTELDHLNKNHHFWKKKTLTPRPPGPIPRPPGPPGPPSSNSCSSPSTPFSSISDSTKFRDFVYKYYPSVAGQHDLWLSTDPRLLRLSKQWNTCSIRKSYSEVDQNDHSKRSIGNLFLLYNGADTGC